MEKNKLYKIIGKNIKKYRLTCSEGVLSQETLAEYVGISTSLLRKLESDKANQGISIETLYKISIVLNVPISSFITEDKNE